MSTTIANIRAGPLAATAWEPTEPADEAYLSIATALATTTLEAAETATASYITPSTRSTDHTSPPSDPTKGKQPATLVVSSGSPAPTSRNVAPSSRALPGVGKSGTMASRKTGGPSLALGSGSGTGTIMSSGGSTTSGGTMGGTASSGGASGSTMAGGGG